jgi:ankyrin repeat protein
MLASLHGHTEALALLLANGANVNAVYNVMYNLNTISEEFDLNTPILFVCRTNFASETRMGLLPLCALHKMGTQQLLRFY